MKKGFSILLAVVMLLGTLACLPFSVSADTYIEGDFEYVIFYGEAYITEYMGEGGDVIIPSTLGGYPVTMILNRFSGLTSIEIPDSVTTIDDLAFSGCEGLTSIEIPSKVRDIGFGVFTGCTGLSSITVAADNSVYYASDNCIIEKETGVLIAGCVTSVIPYGVTEIGRSAFAMCKDLTSIEIPDSVMTIGYSAFDGCSGLTSIEIPSSVTEIGIFAFTACTGLTSIEIPSSLAEIGVSAFRYCTGLTSITVATDNPVYYASGNCIIEKETGILVAGCATSVIPSDVTTIGSCAFEGCLGLTNIKIPDSVTAIGDEAFFDCTHLTSIEIPETVETMGSYVFGDCDSLADIYCLADERPDDWNEDWLAECGAAVHWGEVMPKLALGDLDGNGAIDATDYMLLKRAVLGSFGLTEEQRAVADINHDGEINSVDYMLLKRAVLGTYEIGA